MAITDDGYNWSVVTFLFSFEFLLMVVFLFNIMVFILNVIYSVSVAWLNKAKSRWVCSLPPILKCRREATGEEMSTWLLIRGSEAVAQTLKERVTWKGDILTASTSKRRARWLTSGLSSWALRMWGRCGWKRSSSKFRQYGRLAENTKLPRIPSRPSCAINAKPGDFCTCSFRSPIQGGAWNVWIWNHNMKYIIRITENCYFLHSLQTYVIVIISESGIVGVCR